MIDAGRVTPVLGRIRVVLVRPRDSTNVGATARAMKNMGLRHLWLVGSEAREDARAETAAVHARDLLNDARVVSSVSEAVADCAMVVGTTCRPGLYRSAAQPLGPAAGEVVACARESWVAVLFGPEDHGLTNEDLKHCHRLVKISTDEEYPSLNLAQAALLCCYELRRAALEEEPGGDQRELATADEIEFLFDRLQAAFLDIGFLNPQNPDHIMFAFRRMFGRALLERRDVRILLGLARQIEWYARAGWRLATHSRTESIEHG